jgi:hypothetical protein
LVILRSVMEFRCCSFTTATVTMWSVSLYVFVRRFLLLNLIFECTIGGGILGYAQFPGGSSATDGIVVIPTILDYLALRVILI